MREELLLVAALLLHNLGKQVIKRTKVLVDDVVRVRRRVIGRAANKLVIKVMLGRSRGAQHDVRIGIGREDHVQQLRQVLGVGLVVLGLEGDRPWRSR